MPKNIRYIEIATELNSIGKVLYKQIDFKELPNVSSGSRIRIFDTKQDREDDKEPLLDGFIKRKPWSDNENNDITSIDIDIIKKGEENMIKKIYHSPADKLSINNIINLDAKNSKNNTKESYSFNTSEILVLNKLFK